jgi:hypothetical protein
VVSPLPTTNLSTDTFSILALQPSPIVRIDETLIEPATLDGLVNQQLTQSVAVSNSIDELFALDDWDDQNSDDQDTNAEAIAMLL